MEILLVVYAVAGYWAAGVVVFYNKVVIHTLGAYFILKLAIGTAFGFILIPVAVFMKITKMR